MGYGSVNILVYARPLMGLFHWHLWPCQAICIFITSPTELSRTRMDDFQNSPGRAPAKSGLPWRLADRSQRVTLWHWRDQGIGNKGTSKSPNSVLWVWFFHQVAWVTGIYSQFSPHRHCFDFLKWFHYFLPSDYWSLLKREDVYCGEVITKYLC